MSMERLTDNTDYCTSWSDCEMPEGKCVFLKNCYDRKIYNRLREYEDAEEQGLLLRLPYAIGTELYFPFKCQGVIKDRIRRWQLNTNGLFFCSYAGNAYRLEAIGKSVFLTREEAEVALAEVEE